MTKQEAIEYVQACDENDGPEDVEEARELFRAVLSCEPDEGMGHLDLWSATCTAVAAESDDEPAIACRDWDPGAPHERMTR